MIKKAILRILKFFFVETTVNILGDLFERHWSMWAFIGWGWLSVLVMMTSFASTVMQQA
mgnify:FL=1